MSNGENEGTAGEREETSEPLSSEKPKLRKWVNVNIKFVDGHFLTTFNHSDPRIFHNMEEFLRAVEAEVGKLTVSD